MIDLFRRAYANPDAEVERALAEGRRPIRTLGYDAPRARLIAAGFQPIRLVAPRLAATPRADAMTTLPSATPVWLACTRPRAAARCAAEHAVEDVADAARDPYLLLPASFIVKHTVSAFNDCICACFEVSKQMTCEIPAGFNGDSQHIFRKQRK